MLLVWLTLCMSWTVRARVFEYDVTKLDLFYHQTALTSVLKSKAKAVMLEAERPDAVLFQQCTTAANTPVKYAKCLTELMKARDRPKVAPDPWGVDLAEELAKLFKPAFQNNVEVPKFVNRTSFTRRIQAKLPYIKVSKSRQSSIKKKLFASKLSAGHKNLKKRLGWRVHRRKREVQRANNYKLLRSLNHRTRYHNIEKLREIENFMAKSEFCMNYFNKVKSSNERFRFETKHDDFVEQLMTQLDKVFNASTTKKISIMSPSILSIFPSKSQQNSMLSPEMFSFRESGILSLPQLFKLISSDDGEVLHWLDMTLYMSGASTKLDAFLESHSEEMNKLLTETYPRVKELERMEVMWGRLITDQQRVQMAAKGFAFLEEHQAFQLFGDSDAAPFANLSPRQREIQLENRIREIAALNEDEIIRLYSYILLTFLNPGNHRHKRDYDPNQMAQPPQNNGDSPKGLLVLRPYAFLHQVSEPSVLEGLILSPQAFITEILRPELLTIDLISPRAFVPTILSPQALVTRILSPAAFRMELLSPTALMAWVLSPEALVADILSPRVLEARIASPEALTVQILSPGILSPKVASSEHYAFLVLSPNILSPRFNSTEQMVVEVLSPHILGGDHETHLESAMEEAGHRVMNNQLRGHQHGHNDDGPHLETMGNSVVEDT